MSSIFISTHLQSCSFSYSFDFESKVAQWAQGSSLALWLISLVLCFSVHDRITSPDSILLVWDYVSSAKVRHSRNLFLTASLVTRFPRAAIPNNHKLGGFKQ